MCYFSHAHTAGNLELYPTYLPNTLSPHKLLVFNDSGSVVRMELIYRKTYVVNLMIHSHKILHTNIQAFFLSNILSNILYLSNIKRFQ